uniref:Sphingomyelin phosphodiesterase 1 n=1 Tax=Pipistrellus kuhlii TaxID=59472 RepID=A0A7J7X234_PIPKU|nr:sphingomyelin phosphodiesterase 1 [Pipistrellus kuhlii]
MPGPGVTPGRGCARAGGGERRPDGPRGAPRLGSLGMALALALLPALALRTPAAAHPLPAQGLFASFGGLVSQDGGTFGWRNLTCPACKSLFTVLDFGLQKENNVARVGSLATKLCQLLKIAPPAVCQSAVQLFEDDVVENWGVLCPFPKPRPPPHLSQYEFLFP